MNLVNLMKGNCANEDAETQQCPASMDCKYSMQKDVKVTRNRSFIPLDARKTYIVGLLASNISFSRLVP